MQSVQAVEMKGQPALPVPVLLAAVVVTDPPVVAAVLLLLLLPPAAAVLLVVLPVVPPPAPLVVSLPQPTLDAASARAPVIPTMIVPLCIPRLLAKNGGPPATEAASLGDIRCGTRRDPRAAEGNPPAERVLKPAEPPWYKIT